MLPGVGATGYLWGSVERPDRPGVLPSVHRSPHREHHRAGDTQAERRYHLISEVVLMTDILIRDVPDDVLTAIDAKAKRLGLSRSEYLRRTLDRERVQSEAPVTVEQLRRVATLVSDLDDRAVMDGAWS